MLPQQKIQGMVLMAPQERPMFSPQLVHMMADATYEALRKYMEIAQARPEALRLLDDLILLTGYDAKKEKADWVDNQGIAESIGSVSYDIVALGFGALLEK
jgi:hypothetical protein